MTSRTCIARIPLDDGSDLAASLDADGAADARLWTRTGYASMPTGKGLVIPPYAVRAVIDALKAARRRAAA